MRGETLAERYEGTIMRIEQITRPGYQVDVHWVRELDEEILPSHPKLKTPVVGYYPAIMRHAFYGDRTEAMRFRYKVREGEENLQYVNVMSLYPHVFKCFKFPVGHPVIHVGEAC